MNDQDNTSDPNSLSPSSSAPTSGQPITGSGSDANPAPEPGLEVVNAGDGKATGTNPVRGKGRGSGRGRQKGSKNISSVSPERRVQLQAAGKERGKQLKQDKAHQSRAGKALAAQRGPAYMQEIGAAGHTKAIEATPDLQTKAAKTVRGHRRAKHKRNRRKTKSK